MHSRRPQTLRKAGFGSFGSTGDEGVLGGADERGVKTIIAASKSSGTLNLSNRQLQEVCVPLVAVSTLHAWDHCSNSAAAAV